MNAVLIKFYTHCIGDERYVMIHKTFLEHRHQNFIDIDMLHSRAEYGISDEERGFCGNAL